MFELVGIQGSLFAIRDTDDNVVDILPKSKVCQCLNLGLLIGGITKLSSSEFDYSEEFFPKQEFIEDDEDDDYSDDYDEGDEEYSDEDDEYSDEDDDYSDEEENEEDYYEDYDDDYSDEDDYEEEESVSTVNKLYNFLNEEQVKLLKRYYLWYSQRIFDEGRQQQRTLQVTTNPRKLQKQKELNVMRNNGGMWAYAGFIDMGYRGADYCTLGHPLRYVHLAWDITVSDIETSFFGEDYTSDIEDVINSNSCIKFGIDCISDFFEIDKEYTLKLRKAQREAIKDMDIMCMFYENGEQQEVINSFGVLDILVNAVSKKDAKGVLLAKNYKRIIPKGLSSFYTQFRNLGMVVPKSLVQEIRDNLIGWEEHKFIQFRFPDYKAINRLLVSLLGKKASSFYSDYDLYDGYGSAIKYYVTKFFELKSCGIYEYNADNYKDEGGTSKPARQTLKTLNYTLKNKFWSDAEFTLDFMSKIIDFDTLLTESISLVSEYSVSDEAFNYDTERYYLDTSRSSLNFHTQMEYSESKGVFLSDTIESLRDLQRSRTYSARIYLDSNRKPRTLESALDDLKTKMDLVRENLEPYKAFHNELVQEKIDKLNKARDDEDKARAKEKEEELKAKEEESKTKELSDDEIIKYCTDNKDKVKDATKLKFPLTVLDTVSKTGKCSPKQMYYVRQVYESLTGTSIPDDIKPKKIDLDTRKDLEVAIDKVLDNPNLLEDTDDKEKVYAILTSIKKYRKISERQMKYAEIALKLTSE